MGSEFRVLGFRVLGFRVWGSSFEIDGLGLSVWGRGLEGFRLAGFIPKARSISITYYCSYTVSDDLQDNCHGNITGAALCKGSGLAM